MEQRIDHLLAQQVTVWAEMNGLEKVRGRVVEGTKNKDAQKPSEAPTEEEEQKAFAVGKLIDGEAAALSVERT